MNLEQILEKYDYSYPLRSYEIQRRFLMLATQDELENISKSYAQEYGEPSLKYLNQKYPTWIKGEKGLGWNLKTFDKVNWAIEKNYNKEVAQLIGFQDFINELNNLINSNIYIGPKGINIVFHSCNDGNSTNKKYVRILNNFSLLQWNKFKNTINRYANIYISIENQFDDLKKMLLSNNHLFRVKQSSRIKTNYIFDQPIFKLEVTDKEIPSFDKDIMELVFKYYKPKNEITTIIKKDLYLNYVTKTKEIIKKLSSIRILLNEAISCQNSTFIKSIKGAIEVGNIKIEICSNSEKLLQEREEFLNPPDDKFELIYIIIVIFLVAIWNLWPSSKVVIAIGLLILIPLLIIAYFIDWMFLEEGRNEKYNQAYNKRDEELKLEKFRISENNFDIKQINLFKIESTKLSFITRPIRTTYTHISPPSSSSRNYKIDFVRSKNKKLIKKITLNENDSFIKGGKEIDNTNKRIFQKNYKTSDDKEPIEIILNKLNLESKSAENDGLLGEHLIMEYEKDRISKFGLSTLVKHRSQEKNGDRYGYDIESRSEGGHNLFIEVKTTRGNIKTPFIITRNEFNKMKELSKIGEYAIYRISLYESQYRIIKIIGIENIEAKFDFSPIDYIYKVSTFSDIKSIKLDLNT